MDLKNQMGIQPQRTQTVVNTNHSQLDNIGSTALNGAVHGDPLAKAAKVLILPGQLGNIAAAIENRGHIPLLIGNLDNIFEIFVNLRIGSQIILNIALRLGPRDAKSCAREKSPMP